MVVVVVEVRVGVKWEELVFEHAHALSWELSNTNATGCSDRVLTVPVFQAPAPYGQLIRR